MQHTGHCAPLGIIEYYLQVKIVGCILLGPLVVAGAQHADGRGVCLVGKGVEVRDERGRKAEAARSVYAPEVSVSALRPEGAASGVRRSSGASFRTEARARRRASAAPFATARTPHMELPPQTSMR